MDATQSPLLRCALDTMDGVFLAFTPEGKILQWNQQLEERAGYPGEEIAEMDPATLTGEEVGQIEGRFEETEEESVQFESLLKRKQGEPIAYKFTASLLQQNGGKVICLGGRADEGERAERHPQENAPVESEERYRRLFEEAQEGIAMITPEGEIREVNPAAAEIFGYSQEELQSMNAAELFVDPGEWKTITEDLYQEGLLTGRELRLRRAGGEEIICQISSTLLQSEEGKPKGCQTFFRDVTDRKKAERALKESEEAFRKLTENALVGIGLIKAGSHEYINPAFTHITGYEYEEIKDRPPEIIFHPEDRPAARRRIDKRLEGERKTAHYEARVLTKSGETRQVEVKGARIEHQGEPAIIGTIHDVTERRRRERELRESEERYRRLFEEALEGIAITTPEGDILDANPAAEEIFGYSRGELRAMNAAELYARPEDREAAVEELQEEGVLRRKELHLRRGNGEEIVCETSATVMRGPEGEVQANLAFIRDVTEWKRAEEALKESEEKFRTLTEGALVGIGLIQDGTYEYVNPALAQMTGYSREDLIGASPKSLVHPEDWPHVRKQVERRLDGEIEEVRYETRVQTKEGETRHMEVFGSRITYRGEPTLIAMAQDVTEQRRMQQEMIQVQEEERRRIGQDLHDSLASQLTGANLMLSTLSSKVEAEEAKEAAQEVQAIIQESAGDVRRLSRGLNPGGLKEGDLPSALEGLAQNTEGARFEVEDEVTATLEGETATHLYRIAQEATSNARRHGDADVIDIRLKREDGDLILEVEDEGKGFNPPDVDKEGLGLRSMRHRAELLGADLSVESSPGEGTLVRCRLPL